MTRAKVSAEARYRKRRNDKSRATARNYKKVWTGPELEQVSRDDLTAEQLALELGRTVLAVRAMRWRVRTDPKYAVLAGVPIGAM